MQINAIEHCLAAAEAVQNIDEFKAWVRNHVSTILRNQCMVCSHGRITAAGVLMDHIVAVDFPIEYLAAIQNVAGGIDTPLMRRWFATRNPVYFDAAAPAAEIDRGWLAKFIAHDLEMPLPTVSTMKGIASGPISVSIDWLRSTCLTSRRSCAI